MTEREYILLSDAKALDCALGILRRIVPKSNPFIDSERFVAAIRTLDEMRDAIVLNVKVR